MDINQLSNKIIGAAIEVHKALGPGPLESIYEECLCQELDLRGLRYDRQKTLPVMYKGRKLSGLHLGLILNFNVTVMRDGIKRTVRELAE